jgi:hypothetical protein
MIFGVVMSSCFCFAQAPVGLDAGRIIRIGVAVPSMQMGPAPVAGAPEGIHSIWMKYLSGPSFEIVPIASQLPVQIEAEGRQKACDFVIYSTLSARQKSSSGLGFLKGATQMSNMIPMLNAVHSAAGAVAGAATGSVLSGVAAAASMVKAKSEIALEYRLMAGGSPAPVLSDVVKTKATQDGEDVISGLVEKAAGAVVATILSKKGTL